MEDLSNLSVGFFGTPNFSLEFLKVLDEYKANIIYVVTKPPTKSGRGKIKNFSPVQSWATEKKIEVFTPHDTQDDFFYDQIKKFNVDLGIVVAYGKIIDDKILKLPKFFTINVHASLLPRWRGAAPIQRAILAGDKETGVSIMKVEEGLDSGPLLCEKEIKISNCDTHGSLSKKIEIEGKKLMLLGIQKVLLNDYKLKNQSNSKVTYAKKIHKEEARIQWSESAESINLKIRAFNPFPGAWTKTGNSEERIKILKGEVIKECTDFDDMKSFSGTLSSSLTVKCGKDFLKIIELQREGKKKMTNIEFLNGNKILDPFFK